VIRLAVLAPAVLLALAGCGGPTSQETRGPSAAPATSVEAEEGVAGGTVDSTGVFEQRGIQMGPSRSMAEPGPVEPLVPEPADAPAVTVPGLIGQLRLQPGARFEPPASACQDVLVLVREGVLEATGPGIAPAEAPATLYPGDAVRFGPEGAGSIVNTGDSVARTVVAYTRPEGSAPGFDTRAALASIQAPPGNASACSRVDPPGDPRVRTLRVASERTTAPLVVAGGKLRVRILLDAEGQGARYGGLATLEGDADVRVPEHTHPDSAEILLIEDGEGVMRLGDRQVRVHPGSAIYVPKGTLHDFRGAGTRPLRAIQVYAPSGPEQRFRALAAQTSPVAAPAAGAR
jgi:mannose-6-phosphate isomerase-like protein (cupin superfamily)